ncbi:MAG: hypothetical protein EZS28_017742 [Streblomastix strix]|uniref:Uncharacterized protein n=1 Tax=Streblomastix strix TaxID=222440 RepID=A0A5J4VW93_9EUKA|nr:MAG: hypothetical protein EZS28_017742 [Streblomastix strix]
MQHLEFCPGKHVTWNINQCDELKTLPNHIAQLTSVVSSVRLDALQNIFEEILAVKIEFCRAEQFSELLDGIKPLLGDIQSKEAEKVVSIIELLWAKRFDIIMSERTKIYALFKDKQLGRLMKEAFLNPQTPIYIKENLSYSISLWKCIENVEDSCFIPILDMIQSKLKEEEQYLLQHPNDINHESKWSKYGIQSLEVLLSAFGFYALISDNFQQEIARRDGIQIGLRYLKHQSIQVRIKAANLFRISSNKTIGSEFRKNNDCLAILNDSICNPQFKLVSYEGPMNISPVKHLPHLHTGLLNETGLCLNCDLQHSSNSTDDNYDMEYLDDHYCFSTWSIIVLLRRLYEFINEEEEEKAKKILENEESDVQVECLECGQIIPFGRFLLHMKSHNALKMDYMKPFNL